MSKLAQKCAPPGDYGKATLKHIQSGSLPPPTNVTSFAYRSLMAARGQQNRLRYNFPSSSKYTVKHDLPSSSIIKEPIVSHDPANFISHPVLYNFDDPDGDPWLEEPDQEEESTPAPSNSIAIMEVPSEFHPGASSSNFVSRSFSSTPTPAGFCKGCGDSLSTEMHLIKGPCDQLTSRHSDRVEPPSSTRSHAETQRPLARIPVYGTGLLSVCGGSMPTPMHLANGPCP